MGIDHSNPYIHSTTLLCDYKYYVQCMYYARTFKLKLRIHVHVMHGEEC